MEIFHTSRVESPIGVLQLVSGERGLVYLELPHANGRGFDGWRRRFAPEARCAEGFAPNRAAAAQLLEYLAGKRRDFDLRLDLRGTPFQRRVWDALLEIPYGETRSYRQLAEAIGQPRAVRAVGSANGANPLSLIVPCHRVVRTGGRLGGYGGGTDLKARLLAMEQAHAPRAGLL